MVVRSLRLIGLSVLTLLLFFYAGAQIPASGASDDQEVYQSLSNFTKVLDLIERNYVEKVEPAKLTTSAIEGMLKSLDPYSVYFTPERYKEFEEGTTGEFGGVGIEIFTQGDYIKVIAPFDGTPAQRAGIKPGDLIIGINGVTTRGMSPYEAVKALRGKVGTDVTITLRRARDEKVEDVTLTREVIHALSVKYKLEESGVGYLKLTHFQEKTTEELSNALKELEKENAAPLRGLVLDLRNNPGGLLNQAVDVTDKFIDKGLIVSVRGRSTAQTTDYYASKEQTAYEHPMVVLVNKGSASASEVVAEALQDRKRAVILGDKTFGKGSVQTIIRLDDGSGLKLTTAKFYAPSGRSINGVGVTPDVFVEEGSGQDDVQLTRALELLSSGG